MMKAIIPIFLAAALAMHGTSRAADFFGVPEKTVVPKPPAITPAPATPAPVAAAAAAPPAPARGGPATPVPITGAPADEAPPTLLPDGQYMKTPFVGAAKETSRAFHDLGPDNGVLIGLEYTLGATAEGAKFIESITPIYVRRAGKAHGTLRGTRKPETPATVLEARPGFAVSAIEARGSAGLEAFRVTFTRYENGALDHAERYTTKWFGSDSTETAKLLRTDTRPIVGIYGKADAAIGEFGLIIRREMPAAPKTAVNPFATPVPADPGSLPVPPAADLADEPPAVPASPLEPTAFDPATLRSGVVGGDRGWGNPFRDLAPAGALLVGFDYAVIQKDGPKAASLRPLYLLANASKKPGDLHGEPVTTAHLDARPGYAIGAITARGGALIDGFQLTFMKLKGSALDPRDSYQSDWIGSTSGGTLKRLDGGGQPLIGLFGKSGKEVNEFGIFVKKSATSLSPKPVESPATPATGGLQVFAVADDEFTLFLNGKEILAGNNYKQVESGEFPIVKGDVLTAIVKDTGGGEAWFSLRVVRDGKTLLDAGDMRYLTSETLNWKTNKLTTGFKDPKVWTHERQMGTDPRPRAAWAGPKDAPNAKVLYFKGIVP